MTGVPDFLAPLTVPAALIYGRIIAARNRRYDRGVGVGRLDVPVVSVGNITTGGTGKTPMVMWIARRLIERGRSPAIAMRGYGATDNQPADEALEYAGRVPEAPVIAHPDRLAASREFLREHPGIDCLILDDGFQHRQVHRDLDLVLIDATRDTFTDRLLPAGHLREPPESLARADAVIVTRAAGVDTTLAQEIERHHGRPPLAWARHEWVGFRCLTEEGESFHGPGWIAGRTVVTLLGVGHPESIIDQLEQAGASVAANVPARDHERFTPSKLAVAGGLCDGLDGLVMTGKDWARCRGVLDRTGGGDRGPQSRSTAIGVPSKRNASRLGTPPIAAPLIIPELTVDIIEGREELDRLLTAACGLASSQ